MGKKHFTEEQIAFALRQAESGTSVAEIIRSDAAAMVPLAKALNIRID